MTKKTTIQKEPVKLREKKLANGNVSLYLDIYRNGKRQKEYLKLYLIIIAKTKCAKSENETSKTSLFSILNSQQFFPMFRRLERIRKLNTK